MILSPFTLQAGIEHYLVRKRARGGAENTIRAYRSDLVQFAEFACWLDGCQLVALLGHRHVSRWLDDLNARGLSARSQVRKLAVLRGFVRHARREGWLSHDPTADEQISFRARRVVAPEMDVLLRIVESIDGDDPASVRDRALLRLALDSGLRISEAASLDIPGCGSQTQIDLRRELAHVAAKGGDIETVPFNARTARLIEDWLRVRGDLAQPNEVALFVSRRGTRPTRQMLHTLFKRRAQAAGVPDAHWHLLRHRRIAQIVQICGTKIAQQFARHASESTTGLYGRHADQVAFAMVRERADLDASRTSA